MLYYTFSLSWKSDVLLETPHQYPHRKKVSCFRQEQCWQFLTADHGVHWASEHKWGYSNETLKLTEHAMRNENRRIRESTNRNIVKNIEQTFRHQANISCYTHHVRKFLMAILWTIGTAHSDFNKTISISCLRSFN